MEAVEKTKEVEEERGGQKKGGRVKGGAGGKRLGGKKNVTFMSQSWINMRTTCEGRGSEIAYLSDSPVALVRTRTATDANCAVKR